jgi:hypothetical protein
MQVSATLIAAQQAAREAQARFQQTHAPTLQASFASALTQTAEADGFAPLPLKQTGAQPALGPAAPANAAAPRQPSGKMGGLLDITV